MSGRKILEFFALGVGMAGGIILVNVIMAGAGIGNYK